MKIAQISATFPPYMAGTGNVCYHNALELAERGHDVTVFTSGNPDSTYPYPDSIKVHQMEPIFRIGNAPFIPSLLKIKGFDIIHLHYPFFFGGEMIYLLSKITNQKYIITYHNDVILTGLISPFLHSYKNLIMNKIIHRAEKICVSSLDFAYSCELTTIMNVPSKKFVETPLGVDTKIFNPAVDTKDIRTRYNLNNIKVILFVAGLDKAHYYKGLENLMMAFSTINPKNAVLMIVGDGDLKEYYINFAKNLEILKKTIFLGRIKNYDLPKYYATSTFLVLPSNIESFGLVLIEAMACGKPVIASNLPGVRTVVDHGRNGLLVQPGDVGDLIEKINFLLHNDDICQKYGREGRKKTEEKYSWKPIGERLESVYVEILDNMENHV